MNRNASDYNKSTNRQNRKKSIIIIEYNLTTKKIFDCDEVNS